MLLKYRVNLGAYSDSRDSVLRDSVRLFLLLFVLGFDVPFPVQERDNGGASQPILIVFTSVESLLLIWPGQPYQPGLPHQLWDACRVLEGSALRVSHAAA